MGKFTKGNPGGPGRPKTSVKHAAPIAKAEKQIADRLPSLIENMLALASGGYERVEEEYAPAGSLYIGSGDKAQKMYPELPADELVLVKRKVSIADKDRAANEYLINRILGKPTERQEHSGPDGAPIPVGFGQMLNRVYGDDDRNSEPTIEAESGE
jgi:hypothetical protein